MRGYVAKVRLTLTTEIDLQYQEGSKPSREEAIERAMRAARAALLREGFTDPEVSAVTLEIEGGSGK